VNSSRYLALTALLIAGCGGQLEPAQRAIAEIEAMVAAESGEAASYAPDRLADVQTRLAGLQASFDRQDYAAVLSAAPAVRAAAHGLAAAAAAKKAAAARALDRQWSSLAEEVPTRLSTVQSRLESLGRTAGRRPAAGFDVDAARRRWSAAASRWSKAQAAFATGNLPEAVRTAADVESDLEGFAVMMESNPAAAPARP